MIMNASLRKFALAVHVTTSVGSVGAVAAFLALAIAGLEGRGAYLAMQLTAWYVIVPLVFAALVTGLIQSLGTTWGLFRHWWILVKLAVTLIVATVLLLQLRLIDYLAAESMAPMLSTMELRALAMSPVVHATGGLIVLLVPVALSLYKPKGMTRYGWRRRYRSDTEEPSRSIDR